MSNFYKTYDDNANKAYRNLVHAAKINDICYNRTKHVGSKSKSSLYRRAK